MKNSNFIKWFLNILLLIFTLIFVFGFNFIVKTFETYSSLTNESLSLFENMLSIAFVVSIFAIPTIIIIKANNKNKKEK